MKRGSAFIECGFETADECLERNTQGVADLPKFQYIQASFARLVLTHIGLRLPQSVRQVHLPNASLLSRCSKECKDDPFVWIFPFRHEPYGTRALTDIPKADMLAPRTVEEHLMLQPSQLGLGTTSPVYAVQKAVTQMGREQAAGSHMTSPATSP